MRLRAMLYLSDKSYKSVDIYSDISSTDNYYTSSRISSSVFLILIGDEISMGTSSSFIVSVNSSNPSSKLDFCGAESICSSSIISSIYGLEGSRNYVISMLAYPKSVYTVTTQKSKMNKGK